MGPQILTSWRLPPGVVLNANESAAAARTRVVFDQLLQGVKLHPGGDVVAATVQLADLVVFDVVSFGFLPVSDGEGISTWRRESRGSYWLDWVKLGGFAALVALQVLIYL